MDSSSLASALIGLIFSAIWIVRLRYERRETVMDLAWFFGLSAYAGDEWILCDGRSLNPWLVWVPQYLSIFLTLFNPQWFAKTTMPDATDSEGARGSSMNFDPQQNQLRPLVFPCRTSHTRMFPKSHSFSYSYLFVGIPIGWRGTIGKLLSADMKSLPWKVRSPRSWLSVESADHLERGDHVHGLRWKLESYLRTQKENPEDYQIAYLVTAPRCLGYSFNPVSFWYLYDNTGKHLKAMILEVNNTFDERRMYFLKRDSVDDDSSTDGASTNGALTPDDSSDDELAYDKSPQKSNLAERAPSTAKFTSSWAKDFHVSPFNSRNGSYSLAASDPMSPIPGDNLQINNSITYNSSRDDAKLVARVFSTSTSVDPATLGTWGQVKFMSSWWWVGLVTFPRIVREAGKLFFKRRLRVWFRPEVMKDSIGRKATANENAVAALFRDLLQYDVERSSLTLPLKYIPATADTPGGETFQPKSGSLQSHLDPIIFKPTMPVFYANLTKTATLSQHLRAMLKDQDAPTSNLYATHCGILDEFLVTFERTYPSPAFSEAYDRLSIVERLRWNVVALLRSPNIWATLTQSDNLNHGSYFSALDLHAMTCSNITKAKAYRKATMKLLVSDYIAFGNPMIVEALLWMAWFLASYASAVALQEGCTVHHMPMVEIGHLVSTTMYVHLWWLLGRMLVG